MRRGIPQENMEKPIDDSAEEDVEELSNELQNGVEEMEPNNVQDALESDSLEMTVDALQN